MIVKTNGLLPMAQEDLMNALNVRAEIYTEPYRIEVGQEEVGEVVVVGADAGGEFNEDMYSCKD